MHLITKCQSSSRLRACELLLLNIDSILQPVQLVPRGPNFCQTTCQGRAWYLKGGSALNPRQPGPEKGYLTHHTLYLLALLLVCQPEDAVEQVHCQLQVLHLLLHRCADLSVKINENISAREACTHLACCPCTFQCLKCPDGQE